MQESIQRYCCVNMRNSKYLSCRPFQFFKKNTYAYGLGPDQSHYNQSRLWSRLHNTLTQITRISPKWLYTEYTALKLFSPDVWATCACPSEFAQKFFTVLNILFTFRIFEQLALKNSVPRIHCIEYFLSFRVFEKLALALKNRVALKILTLLKCFHHSGFLSNLRLPWKHSFPGNF